MHQSLRNRERIGEAASPKGEQCERREAARAALAGVKKIWTRFPDIMTAKKKLHPAVKDIFDREEKNPSQAKPLKVTLLQT